VVVGSGAVAGSVVGATAAAGVAGGLIFLLILRRKRDTAIPFRAEKENQEFGESFGSEEEFFETLTETNAMSNDVDESLTIHKLP
jgi:hypothetical protein